MHRRPHLAVWQSPEATLSRMGRAPGGAAVSSAPRWAARGYILGYRPYPEPDARGAARQVLPLVEAFFVLCDARTPRAAPGAPAPARGASAELPGAAPGPAAAGPVEGAPGARAASAGPAAPGGGGGELPAFLATPAPAVDKAALDAQLPFLRCAACVDVSSRAGDVGGMSAARALPGRAAASGGG